MTLNKSKFLANILVLDIQYKHLRSPNNNLFYFFNVQLDDVLIYYFAKSEINKCNINSFFTNLLMKLIIKKLLYYNAYKWIEKLSAIP